MATKQITPARRAELEAIGATIAAGMLSSFGIIRDAIKSIASKAERQVVKVKIIADLSGKIEKSKGGILTDDGIAKRVDRALDDAGLAWTSKKAKGKGKGADADADVGGEAGKALTVSGKDAVARLLQMTTFIAEWQPTVSDPLTLDKIAKLLAIAQGATAKAGKRDKSSKAAGPVRTRKSKSKPIAATVAVAA